MVDYNYNPSWEYNMTSSRMNYFIPMIKSSVLNNTDLPKGLSINEDRFINDFYQVFKNFIDSGINPYIKYKPLTKFN